MTQIPLNFNPSKKKSVKQLVYEFILNNPCRTGFEIEHEINLHGFIATEGSISKRCRELRAEGKIRSHDRPFTNFVEFYI